MSAALPLSDDNWVIIRDALFRGADARELGIRREIDLVLWACATGAAKSEAMTLGDLAALGEVFLDGVESMFTLRAHNAAAFARAGIATNAGAAFPEEGRQFIRSLIGMARTMAVEINELEAAGLVAPTAADRNAKPWQGEAIRRLSEVWRDVRGPARRGDQKVLVEFVRAALAPLGLNVNADAVATTLKRQRHRS